jgi:hypothetical protein
MRPVVPSVGLVALAVAMSVSACVSSSSRGSAAASGSIVAASSPAAASASAIQASSPAPACLAVAGWANGSRSPAAAGQLFVAGSPTQATLCQYVLYTTDGSSLPPPVLVQIAGHTLTDLVASLNALVPTKDEPPCPAPLQADVLTFDGGGAPSSTVRIDREGGCDFVWSDTGVHAYATNGLSQQLAAIVAIPPGSASPAAGSSSAVAVAVGDAAAVSKCQAAENARQAAILRAGGTTPALTVAAGFTTTEGDAHRYADSIGLRPGDPSPRPADSSSSYTNTTPAVACILDGYIEAPSVPGNPPYSREFALIGPGGTLDLLVAGRTNTISLQNPSSAMP